MKMPLPMRFSYSDAFRAHDEWGCNCGPSAVAAILGMTLDEIRPHLGDFDKKRYTNPKLMWAILNSAGARWRLQKAPLSWPKYGLARIQWEGPWTQEGVPMRVRYRHTHWVGACTISESNIGVWDVNCINNGSGWVALSEWCSVLVPFLLKETTPKANGKWHITHSIEVESR